MNQYSRGQLKALSEFFNTIAAAWFTSGIIIPFFARFVAFEKLTFFLAGLAMAYFFLNISLQFAKEA